MGIGNIFRAFQPKDKIFFVLFEKVAQKLVEMSKEFHEGLKDFDLNDETLLNKMSDYEHEMDDLTHEIFVQLGENFITPFDREDINLLTSGLDDIADYIYASSKYIYLYKSPEVKEACIKINSFENIADDVLSQGIVSVFESNDPIKIIKVKSVLEYLEIVTDKAEDVANTIENIVIKYA